MRRFDKNRPHGVVVGDPEGRAYHQDGIYFDAQGREFGVAEASLQAKRGKRAAEAAPEQDPPPPGTMETPKTEAELLAEAQLGRDDL